MRLLSRSAEELRHELSRSIAADAYRDFKMKVRHSHLFGSSTIYSKACATTGLSYEAPLVTTKDYFVVELKLQPRKAHQVEMMQEFQVTTLAERPGGGRFIRVISARICAIPKLPRPNLGHQQAFEGMNGSAFFFWYLSVVLEHCRATFEASTEPRHSDFIRYLVLLLFHARLSTFSADSPAFLASCSSALARCPKGLRDVLILIFGLSRLFAGMHSGEASRGETSPEAKILQMLRSSPAQISYLLYPRVFPVARESLQLVGGGFSLPDSLPNCSEALSEKQVYLVDDGTCHYLVFFRKTPALLVEQVPSRDSAARQRMRLFGGAP